MEECHVEHSLIDKYMRRGYIGNKHMKKLCYAQFEKWYAASGTRPKENDEGDCDRQEHDEEEESTDEDDKSLSDDGFQGQVNDQEPELIQDELITEKSSQHGVRNFSYQSS